MRTLRKTFAATLAVALAVTSVNMTDATKVSAAAGKIKVLTGKSETLVVGEDTQPFIKTTPKELSKKLKYASSNKKIAKVSSKGVIKAIKPGKATITVKASGAKSVKIAVTVNPKKVKTVSLSKASDTSLKVSWAKQSGVDGYEVYIATSAKGKYTKKATVKGASKTSTTLTNMANGTYYAKVRAYKKVGSKNLVGAYSPVSSGVTIKVWKLVWSDEFNGTSLNMNNWTYETGHGQDGWGNQEWQDYTAGGNIKFDGKNLIIIPRVQYDTSKREFIKTSASSTRIQSKGKKEFKYGKMEIRAKAAKAQGAWSAGWMLGNDIDKIGWPRCGEIDIMESMNGATPQTIHCWYFNNQSWSHGNKNFDSGISQWQAANEFHTYGVIWDDHSIQFTVDGVKKGLYDPSRYSKTFYKDLWGDSFMSPFFFILNCAIGGNAAGTPGLNGWTKVKTEGNIETYEDYFYIDYVRAYQ